MLLLKELVTKMNVKKGHGDLWSDRKTIFYMYVSEFGIIFSMLKIKSILD